MAMFCGLHLAHLQLKNGYLASTWSKPTQSISSHDQENINSHFWHKNSCFFMFIKKNVPVSMYKTKLDMNVSKLHNHIRNCTKKDNSIFSSPHSLDFNMLVIFSSQNIKWHHKLQLTFLCACWIKHEAPFANIKMEH